MSRLLRHYSDGIIYFVTSVTYKRQSYLESVYSEVLSILKSVNEVEIISWVFLPDHIHLIVDPKDNNLSDYIKRFKLKAAYAIRKQNYLYRQKIWQSRFWDHGIRNQTDMNNHIDYIHYNPVKHGMVKSPFDWEYSSIHEYKSRGYYPDDWGAKDSLEFDGEYGE